MNIDMLRSVFLLTARVSFEASVIVCLLLLVRWMFGSRLSAAWRHVLWLVVVIRLLMPLSLPSPTSIFNVIRSPSIEPPRFSVPQIPRAAVHEGSARKTLEPPISATVMREAHTGSFPLNGGETAAIAWAAVMLFLTARIVIGNARLTRTVCRLRPVTDQQALNLLEDCKEQMDVHIPINVVVSPHVKSPALLGFIRPRLLLPENLLESFDSKQMENIFMHELAHLKRGDVALNWVVTALQVLHWFNPLLWIAFRRMKAEREMACDALAMSRVGTVTRSHYGETIVGLIEYSARAGIIPGVVGIVEDKTEIKRRIAMIACYKQETPRGAALAAVLLVLLAAVGLTGAQTPLSSDAPAGSALAGQPSVQPAQAPVTPVAETPRRNGKIVVALNPLSSSSALNRQQDAVSMVMQAELSQSETVTLVEREEMHRILKELQLGQQGALSPESARELGRIAGARYFCGGHLRSSGGKIMATVKVIDVETTLTKLAYEFLVSENDAAEAGKALARQVETLIAQFEGDRAEREETLAAEQAEVPARNIPAAWQRPAVMVMIRETHIRQPAAIDPAGETEIVKRCLESGFRVVDAEYAGMMKSGQAVALTREKRPLKFTDLKTAAQYAAQKGAGILLYGEAVSEYGAGLEDFEGCRARIELKAIDVRTEQILLADSAYGGATDLAEITAGKKAIQQAANRLADRFLYDLAEKWNAAP